MTASEGGVRFPAGFIWGSGTSAYQVEGAVDEDGRTPSIWDTFCMRDGAVLNGDSGAVAADQYHRYPDDARLLRELGHGMYRFSVAWPRIQPDPSGAVNQRGLDHYRRLVDALLEQGVEPNVTLYHWDLPQWLADAGGWPVRDTAARFAEYAAIVYEALHDRVDWWGTLNEPWCSSLLSYAAGVHAPGMRDRRRAVRAVHHLLLAHGQAMAAMRAIDATPRLGIVLNPAPVVAAPGAYGPSMEHGMRAVDGWRNRVWLEALLAGRYPADVVDLAEPFGGLPVQDGDLAAIAAPLDWLGINYYQDLILGLADTEDELHPGAGPVREDPPPGSRTSMGWPITPGGLTDILVRIREDWPNVPPMVVSENGAAWDDPIGPDGTIDDERRRRYLRDHLAATAAAIERGVDVRGYLVWSLLDNFEWAWGYQERFGIVHVDYATQVRTPRKSAWWLRDVARANGWDAGSA